MEQPSWVVLRLTGTATNVSSGASFITMIRAWLEGAGRVVAAAETPILVQYLPNIAGGRVILFVCSPLRNSSSSAFSSHQSLQLILMFVPPTIIGRVEQRIQETGPADRINSLILDQIPIGTFTEQLKKLLEKCDKLEHFSLESCSLDSLENFPNLPKLEVVELNNNRLSDSDIGMLSKFPKMRRIFIKDNRIDNLESLDVLGCLGELVQLQLNGNPVIEAQNYRQSIFNTVKSLQILDNKDRDGVDIDDISEEVQYSVAQSEGSESDKQVSQDEDSGDDQSCSDKQEDGEDSPAVDVARKMRKPNPQ